MVKPEQYFLNTACTANELAEQYDMTITEAHNTINAAIMVVKTQRALELKIKSKEDKIKRYASR